MGIGATSTTGRKKFIRQPDGRDEFNLAEFPLTLLSDKTSPDVRTIEWEDEITDRGSGLEIKRKVIVTGSHAYGLPTALDADVLFALIQLTKHVNNFTSRDLSFSRYELLRVLDWRDDGKSYRRIEESLNRWVGTSIYFSAWRDKESETWQSEKFHVFDNVTLVSAGARRRLRATGQGELACSSISWNRVVFRNLQAGYVCPVDLDLYFSLKRAVSKRIFRYLGKHFRLRQSEALTFDLKVFAFEKIGLSRSYRDVGQIKKELQPAIDELEAAGFLSALPREERYTKVSRGEWLITLSRGTASLAVTDPGQTAAPRAETEAPPPSGPERDLVIRGVTRVTAGELLNDFGAEAIARQIAVFDWLAARKDRRVSKNPAGYLVESIRRDYTPPKGYAKAAAPAAPRPAAVCVTPSSTQDTPLSDDPRIWSYWETLAPLEQQAHINEVLRSGNRTLVTLYQRARQTSPQAAAGYLRVLLTNHLRNEAESSVLGPAAPNEPTDAPRAEGNRRSADRT